MEVVYLGFAYTYFYILLFLVFLVGLAKEMSVSSLAWDIFREVLSGYLG